ncbi:hypothetical protein R9C00_17885 [Flammeovirgaceae bacterium SG7u.111]|nr:hypothetical protein [Flammeovirgaceae bacterium SG7u.132]WPO33575.1 hypothetical protein R9C00_17885 [Flammeovirgaceae bacterium SG7u.111]
MKPFLFFSSFLIFPFAQLAAQKQLLYKNHPRLSWNDFKASPDISNTKVGAIISSTIQMEMKSVNSKTGIITFTACAVMYPYQSWVKIGYNTEQTLNHEQLHFDISQLMAKKLEASINKQKLKVGEEGRIQKMFDDYNVVLVGLQKKYNRETEGGVNTTKQAEWDEKIRSELLKFQ